MENATGLSRLDRTTARAVGVKLAGDVIDEIGRRSFLHAGPPLKGKDLAGPMRGAVLGALVLEGEATDIEEAAQLLDGGEVTLRSCHEAGAVGAMAGVISPSIPVLIVEGDTGQRSYAPLNEGLGQALRFGSTSKPVLEKLRWMGQTLAPVLDSALELSGGLDISALQAEGLRRGDECHNRNVASTAALIVFLAPHIIRSTDTNTAASVIDFLSKNPHTFLTFSMAAAKLVADAAHAEAHPGLVTAIAANGLEMGIRVSGLEGWFTAPAPLGNPRLFDGYTLEDVCPAMGDSFVTEVIGIGAFALLAAPAISSFIGGTPEQARQYISEMREITLATSSRFLVPHDNFQGTPLGISASAVATTGIGPVVNNGFAHRLPGQGQVGAGITRLPVEPFADAHAALAEQRVAV